MTQTDVPDCRWCRWMHWPRRTCDAFPHGIPEAIYYYGQTHYAHVDGDGGKLFEVASQEMLSVRGYGQYPAERLQRARQAALYADQKEYADWAFGTILCQECEHYGSEKGTCRAFPQGIPLAIVGGVTEHREPIDGDGGLTYKKRSKNV